MGWKLSSIFIKPETDINYEILLEEIGFSNFKQIDDQPYDRAIFPDADKVYIGTYKNNLIISACDLPFEFLNKSLSVLEEKLITLFPHGEICAATLNSTTNSWGYSIIKDGKKIRAKAGDFNNGTILDFGAPLEEEMELLSKSRLNQDGIRMYYLGNNSEEGYFEHQVGESFVFAIIKRYTGTQLDYDDELLLETNFKGFHILPQIEAGLVDEYFTGQYEGYYALGEGYRESLIGRRTLFSFQMEVCNGEIKGTRMDEDKQEDSPATVTGLILGRFIHFYLQYPILYIIDKNDEIKKDKSKSYGISYTGLYDYMTETFRGVWNIDNKKLWGDWFMKRKEV